MEQRILSYSKEREIPNIIETLFQKDFLLVRHSTRNKQLFFKHFDLPPGTKEETQ
jgi:hypothetical protein